jgi:hypothetical protein
MRKWSGGKNHSGYVLTEKRWKVLGAGKRPGEFYLLVGSIAARMLKIVEEVCGRVSGRLMLSFHPSNQGEV